MSNTTSSTPAESPLLLRAGQTAGILGISPTALNLLIARGDLSVVKKTISGHRLFDYETVRALRRRRDKAVQRAEKQKPAEARRG